MNQVLARSGVLSFFIVALLSLAPGCSNGSESAGAAAAAETETTGKSGATSLTIGGGSDVTETAAADSALPQTAGDEAEPAKPAANPVVVIATSLGDIEVELDSAKAPITVANFLSYVDAKHYDGTIFHRVISNFMIQGGGFSADMKEKKTGAPIKNEAGNGLSNNRGTIAMARTNVVDSATAQFFINVKDNSNLNHTSNTMQGYGYAVFGKVTQGMDVVDKIRNVRTGTKMMPGGYPMGDVPQTTVTIKSISRK